MILFNRSQPNQEDQKTIIRYFIFNYLLYSGGLFGIMPSADNDSMQFKNLVGFPSGQREQTVNLPSQTSKVRILPPPPSKIRIFSFPNQKNTFILYK